MTKSVKKENTRNRAKISILSSLFSYPAIGNRYWGSYFDDTIPVPGDLVSLSSCAENKWYLSWVVEYKNDEGYEQYLLKSIEDGSLCWWSNVGINIYNRDELKKHPTWKWDDKQFAFYDRWKKVCFNQNGAYMVLPLMPEFNKNGSVKLGCRIRYGISSLHNPKVIPNWKKFNMKQMNEYYGECVDLYEKSLNAKKCEMK